MRSSILFILLIAAIALAAQPTYESSLNVQDYVINAFQGTGVVISTVSMNGFSGDSINEQIGSYNNNSGYLPLEEGVIMSTGAIIGEDFDGNPTYPGHQMSNFLSNPQYGDSDLEMLSGLQINDQAILEFDAVPAYQYLTFNYVFASEEYPEYVNSFNDVFGFFVSGPGLSGPFSNNATNIAVLPDSSTIVSINSVNNGNNGCYNGGPAGPCINCEYYIDNCPIDSIAFDGMTTTLTAVLEVIPGESYHFKLAVGDALDGVFDSAIYLEQYSFKSITSLPLGLEEFDQINALYPNPSDGEISIDFKSNDVQKVTVMDIQGSTVKTLVNPEMIGSRLTLDLQYILPGTYFINVESQSRSSTRKVTLF